MLSPPRHSMTGHQHLIKVLMVWGRGRGGGGGREMRMATQKANVSM